MSIKQYRARERGKLDEQIAKARRAKKLLASADVRRELARIGRAAKSRGAGVIDVYISAWGGPSVTVTVGVSGLDSFKEPRLLRLLERLEERLGVNFASSMDRPSAGHRVYSAERYGQIKHDPAAGETYDGYFSLNVHAFVKEDAAGCRKVVVGEDHYASSSPRYAFVCD